PFTYQVENMKQKTAYLICFLCTVFISLATSAQVQDKKINLPDGPLTDLKIVAAIKEQSGLRFNYAASLQTKLAVAIKSNSRQVTVKAALELIKNACGLNYEIDGEYITLRLPSTPKAPAGVNAGSLEGTITDLRTKGTLQGVTIQLSGT